MKRIGVVGIVLKGDKAVAVEMQKVLSEFADIIIGRMGVPRKEANAIALIVEGTQERISALTGKLGRFESLSVKSAITSFELAEYNNSKIKNLEVLYEKIKQNYCDYRSFGTCVRGVRVVRCVQR